MNNFYIPRRTKENKEEYDKLNTMLQVASIKACNPLTGITNGLFADICNLIRIKEDENAEVLLNSNIAQLITPTYGSYFNCRIFTRKLINYIKAEIKIDSNSKSFTDYYVTCFDNIILEEDDRTNITKALQLNEDHAYDDKDLIGLCTDQPNLTNGFINNKDLKKMIYSNLRDFDRLDFDNYDKYIELYTALDEILFEQLNNY